MPESVVHIATLLWLPVLSLNRDWMDITRLVHNQSDRAAASVSQFED